MSFYALCGEGSHHAKVVMAGNEAYGAWCRAGQWSSEHLTEGLIPRDVALSIGPARLWKKLADARPPGHEHGLVEIVDGGWLIHDFLHWNPSRAEVLEQRSVRSEAKKRAGQAGGIQSGITRRREADAKQTRSRHEAEGQAKPKQNEAPSPSPSPSGSFEPDPLLRAPARVKSDPERAELQPGDDPWSGRSEVPPSPPEIPDRLTLAETYAAVEARPAGELDKLARELAAEGNAFGARCCSYLDAMQALPPGMRKTLREILDERSRPRPSSVRRTPSLTAEEQALVTAYLAAQKRYRRVDSPQLELHGRAAQRALPDLETIARSLRRDGFEPTALTVWEHKLEQYFAISDPRLAEQGYPMPLVLARTDGLELPRPKRKRDPPPSGPSIVEAEPRASEADIRAAAAKFGWSQEALEKALKETGT